MSQAATSPGPEPRYRWVIVIAAALVLGIAMGQLVNGLSVFFLPLEAEFGWSRGAVAGINSAGLVGIALGGIVMGFLADRIGVRAIVLTGAVAIPLATILAARAEALWQFYALFFLAGALGGGALFAPVIALVGGWFRTGAGLAIGIASAGQALGQGGVPWALGHLISWTGWQSALTILGLVTAATLIPLALLLRPAPAPPPQPAAAPGRAPLPTALVLPALSLAVLGCCTGMAVPLMHLVPLIQGATGLGAEAGGPLLTMLVAGVGGRIFFGRLSDMIGALPAWMAATAWQTALMMGFLLMDSLTAFFLFAPLYGFGYGGVMTGVLVSVRALTPAARRASATGIVLSFGWLGHALGGWQGGALFDLTGAYTATFAVATAAGAANLLIVGSLLLALRQRGAPAAA
ncbi:MFS transporter [Histidinibacterium aquaticum]|uniref:MFS transporter n=1 Tax=Histidinibacterium aquaticum TaxID=2613962 RepID=A0A5J5GIN5_9RHOB|nr:MFS transporter [Histidinibacterium aquaticum]KAA9007987.1 MFS transporter [Histidinibacterium aquaticum]